MSGSAGGAGRGAKIGIDKIRKPSQGAQKTASIGDADEMIP